MIHDEVDMVSITKVRTLGPLARHEIDKQSHRLINELNGEGYNVTSIQVFGNMGGTDNLFIFVCCEST